MKNSSSFYFRATLLDRWKYLTENALLTWHKTKETEVPFHLGQKIKRYLWNVSDLV